MTDADVITCRSEATMRCFVSLNILLSHWRLLKVIANRTIRRSVVTTTLSCIIFEIKQDIGRKSRFLPRDAMHERGLAAVVRCPFVTFVYSRNETYLQKNFNHRVATPLVFQHQTLWQYTDEYPYKLGQQSRFSTNIWLWHRSLLDRRVSSTFLWCTI